MSTSPDARAIQPEDLFRLKFLQGARLSPDGTLAAYGVSQVDAVPDEETVGIWLKDLVTGESRPLTSGTARDMNAQWSPDGERIAFVSTRGGAPQIYVSSVGGDEARAPTAMPTGVGGGPIWSPDGKEILFTSRPLGAKPRDPKLPYRLTRPLYRFDGMGYVEDAIQDVYVAASGGGERWRRAQASDTGAISEGAACLVAGRGRDPVSCHDVSR